MPRVCFTKRTPILSHARLPTPLRLRGHLSAWSRFESFPVFKCLRASNRGPVRCCPMRPSRPSRLLRLSSPLIASPAFMMGLRFVALLNRLWGPLCPGNCSTTCPLPFLALFSHFFHQQLIQNNILSAPVYDKEHREFIGFLDVRDLVSFVVFVYDEQKVNDNTRLRDLIQYGTGQFKMPTTDGVTVSCSSHLPAPVRLPFSELNRSVFVARCTFVHYSSLLGLFIIASYSPLPQTSPVAIASSQSQLRPPFSASLSCSLKVFTVSPS